MMEAITSLFPKVLAGNFAATVGLPLILSQLCGEGFNPSSARALKLSAITAIKMAPVTTLLSHFVIMPLVATKWSNFVSGCGSDAVSIFGYWVALLAIGDFDYYWLHRILHHANLYWMHKEHHTFTHKTGILATNAISVLDGFISSLLGFLVVPLLLLPGAPMESIGLYIIMLLAHGNHIHSSSPDAWDFYPFTHPTEHAVHHRYGGANSCNFGGISMFWDKLFGTYRAPGFHRTTSNSIVDRKPKFHGQSRDWAYAFWAGALLVLAFSPRYTGTGSQCVGGKAAMSGDALAQSSNPLVVEFFNTVAEPFKTWLIPMDKPTLLCIAKERSGLDTFWGQQATNVSSTFSNDEVFQYWNDGLDAVLADVNDESSAQRNALGRFMIREQLLGGLVSQLRVTDAIIKAGPLNRNNGKIAIITGLPRTGSTALHSMLCSHPDAACLRFYEALNPIGEPNQMIIAKIGLAMQAWLTPWIRHMFPLEADIPFEEILLTANLFSTWQYAFDFSSAHYRQWYNSLEHDIAYEYVRTVYQALDQQSNSTHKVRVMKSPQHFPNMGAVKRVFPEANIVVTTRYETQRVVESLLTIFGYGNVGQFSSYNLEQYGPEALATLAGGYSGRSRLSSLDVTHTSFEDLCEDATAVGRRIIDIAGLDPIPDSEIMKELRPRKGAKKLSYHLDAFGLTVEDVVKANIV